MSLTADTRLYASTIAIVSGIYSIASTIGGMGAMPMNDSVMLLIGVVALAHGTVLLTPLAERLGRLGGPLMVLWAAVMIGNQFVAATISGGSMRSMTWDGGMIALAVLMLASGLIMSRARRM
ncbi:MAG TPA: hypothetical protein VMQ65_03315 [Candidatus Limnocylindria bacterium]|nr:hypothetical protein [Candidatus Limnocylindria bacterium]